MLKKIKDFFLEMLYAPSGTALTVFAIMLLISIFSLINTTLLFGSNAFMLVMIPIAFIVPMLVFWHSRGGKKYLPTIHFELPKKVHIPTVLFSFALIILGSALIKMLVFEGKYTEFHVFNTFFAHRNGSFWNDIYITLAFCIVVPVLEGLVFRGALIREHDKRGRLVAGAFSSIMFALLGFSFEELLPRFFIGVMLCIILYATDSIVISIALHIAYNFFAVFFEPTVISVKTVSSNFALFAFLWTIATIVVAIFAFTHLSHLYRKYSHDKFGENEVRSTPREKSFWNLAELCTTIPALACIVLFFVTTLLVGI